MSADNSACDSASSPTQSTLFDSGEVSPPQSCFGRMCQASCRPMTAPPSDHFLAALPDHTMLCEYQAADCSRGRTLVVCLDRDAQSPGVPLMPNISEWPNDAAVCSLSQVLVRGLIPPQYYLSAKACAGILRRAEKRGKALPAMLQRALKETVRGGAIDVAPALVASDSPHGRQDFASEAFVADVAPTICNEGKAAGSLTQQAVEGGAAIVCFAAGAGGHPTSSLPLVEDGAPTLRTTNPLAVCYDPAQVTSPGNRSNPRPGTCHTLPAEAQAPICVTGDATHALTAEGHDASEDGTGRGTPICVHPTQDPISNSNVSHALATGSKGGQANAAVTEGMRVRRLLPVECERLQGFPDGYTAIKGAKDGPRYKALGNSWAVPCVRWIGQRIVAAIAC